MEIWKTVKDFEGYYEVSNFGRVRSVDREVNADIKHSNKVVKHGKILKPNLKKQGYLTVDLCKGNIKKTTRVHRIVAEAFLPKVDGKDIINHINCNTSDNRVSNLEWCTHKENTQHASSLDRMYCGHRKKIKCIELNRVFDSSYKAAEWLNETKFQNSKRVDNIAKNIRACCIGKRKHTCGYSWEDLI